MNIKVDSLLDSLPSSVAFLGIVGVLVVFVLAGGVLYLFQAIGLYKMARNKNMYMPWLAFIPIANRYLLGTIIGNFKIFKYTIQNPGIVILLAPIISFFIPKIGPILILVFNIFVAFLVFKRYAPEKAELLLILSIASLGFLFPFIIFAIRNNEPYHAENSSSQELF